MEAPRRTLAGRAARADDGTFDGDARERGQSPVGGKTVIVPKTQRPGSAPADLIDAVLLVPPPPERPRLSYKALLIAEGYRVTEADNVEAAITVAARGAALDRKAVVAYDDWLRPLKVLGVPVVLLGEGWEARLKDSCGEPSVEVGNAA